MSWKWRDWNPTLGPFGTHGHPGLVPTGYGSCSFLEIHALVSKPMKEQIPAVALSQGLRQHLGRKSRDSWCQPGWVSARGDGFASSNVLPGITKATTAYCQGKEGPSSLLGSSSASSCCLFGFGNFPAYRNVLPGTQRAPARPAGTSSLATLHAPQHLA